MRRLAIAISWLLRPIVAVVLGWRWAWDALREPSTEVSVSRFTDCTHSVIVTWPSGRREVFDYAKRSGWKDAKGGYVSPRIAAICEVAVVVDRAAKSEDES
jgi:hypothetical protein